MWRVSSTIERERLRHQAELNAVKDAGEKFVAVSLALNELLRTVAQIAGDVNEEADRLLRIMSTIIVAGSIGLAGLVIFINQPSKQSLNNEQPKRESV